MKLIDYRKGGRENEMVRNKLKKTIGALTLVDNLKEGESLKSTPLAAVIGRPIFHSRSPQIYNQIFKFLGMKVHYLRLASSSLEEALTVIKELNIPFFNVTSPYKEEILNFLDEIHPEAQSIGAVNIVIKKKGKLIGFNTDWNGFLWASKSQLLPTKENNILVLGAGGAARSVLYALNRLGYREVFLTNRTSHKGKNVAQCFGYSYLSPSSALSKLKQFDLIVSCLPYTNYFISQEKLKELNLIEATYRTFPHSKLETRGLEWLLGQAIEGARLFTGRKINSKQIEAISKILYRLEPQKKNIALIGFMGCGKTEVGRRLAAKIGWSFIDTDDLIEKQTAKKIEKIIAEKGESGFREIEARLIPPLLCNQHQTIIALGGGAVIKEEVRQALAQTCYVLWLWTPLEKLLPRIQANSRPLLAGQRTFHERKHLFQKRIPLYSECCDLLIPNNEGDINKCVRLIYEEISFAL